MTKQVEVKFEGKFVSVTFFRGRGSPKIQFSQRFCEFVFLLKQWKPVKRKTVLVVLQVTWRMNSEDEQNKPKRLALFLRERFSFLLGFSLRAENYICHILVVKLPFSFYSIGHKYDTTEMVYTIVLDNFTGCTSNVVLLW